MLRIDSVNFPQSHGYTELDLHNNGRHTSRTEAFLSLNIVSPSPLFWCRWSHIGLLWMGLVDFQTHILEGIFEGTGSSCDGHARDLTLWRRIVVMVVRMAKGWRMCNGRAHRNKVSSACHVTCDCVSCNVLLNFNSVISINVDKELTWSQRCLWRR